MYRDAPPPGSALSGTIVEFESVCTVDRTRSCGHPSNVFQILLYVTPVTDYLLTGNGGALGPVFDELDAQVREYLDPTDYAEEYSAS